jgi:ketosteroid isomerase-like protein
MGQQPAVRAETNPSAETEIKELESKLAAWIVRGAWDEYGLHLAADYVHTGYNGQVESKEETMAALRDEHRKIIIMELEPADQRVRVYGDTAIFNAEFTVSVRDSGQVKSHRLRVTDVFVRREGAWYLVAGQSTGIGK